MLEGIGDGGVGAHRVAREAETALSDLILDHRLQVGDELRVYITRSRGSSLPYRGRIGLPVAARVVGNHRVPGALQDTGPMNHRDARRRDPMAEDDRRPLPRPLAPDRRPAF